MTLLAMVIALMIVMLLSVVALDSTTAVYLYGALAVAGVSAVAVVAWWLTIAVSEWRKGSTNHQASDADELSGWWD